MGCKEWVTSAVGFWIFEKLQKNRGCVLSCSRYMLSSPNFQQYIPCGFLEIYVPPPKEIGVRSLWCEIQVVKMPPSPALRFSQARQLRTHNHRRGRSLEGGLQLKERDDDLALFNNMQARKRENFLLQSMDDLDESLCRFQNRLIFSKLLVLISCAYISVQLDLFWYMKYFLYCS